MGKKEDEKYTSETDNDSQVRSIINQLNAEHPSREKSREVVVRADGTKAICVVKKRKVMVSREDKNRRARHQFIYGLLVFILLLGSLFALAAFRFSQYSSSEYYEKLSGEICRALGAQRVQLVGADLRGLQLKIANVVADFPEGMMVERLEMSDLSCELAASSFFTGKLKTNDLKIGRAMLYVPITADKVSVPRWQGEEIWHIKRMECADFSCVYGDKEAASVAILHADAYMYYPGRSIDSRVLMMRGGTFRMVGWRPLQLQEGKVQVSPLALENIRLKLTPDVNRSGAGETTQYMEITGHLMDGAGLDTELNVVSEGMAFSDFSMGRFDRIFTALTADDKSEKKAASATIVLPFKAEHPVFGGLFPLRDVKVPAGPALMEILEHIPPVKRKKYLPIKLNRACVKFTRNGNDMRVTFEDGDFSELDLITMSADIAVNSANEISGSLNYGIPAILTHIEYPDGNADPLFRDDGATAWVSVELSGTSNAPTDNIDELIARAEVARRNRPARTPFENIDVDSFVDKVMPRSDAPQETPADGQSVSPRPINNSGNPFEQKSDNPFAPSSSPFGNSFGGSTIPSDGGLMTPADNSIFPTSN